MVHKIGRLSMKSGLQFSTGLAVLLMLTEPSFAQQRIEQMIVTAQKRAQDIQAVPASISAFSGAGLEQRQIKSIDDLSKATPNLSFTNSNNGTMANLSIRGVSADTVGLNVDQPTALHIDGIYQPFPVGLNLIMGDLESVEILRGPQGTLYGRNANAGVVNLITGKPTDEFEGSGTIFGGSYGRYGARGYVSGPVTDGISLRLSGIVDRLEGYGKDLTTGERVEGKWSYGTRLAIRLKPTENITADISASYNFEHNTSPAYLVSQFGQSGPNIDAIRASPFSVISTNSPHRTYEDTPGEAWFRVKSASAIIAWDITPEITLKSLTGFQTAEFARIFGLDATPAPHIWADSGGTVTRTISQEFNFNARLWDRLNLVAGLFYLYDIKSNVGNDVMFPRGVPFNVGTTFGFGFDSRGRIDRQETESKAAFLDLTFDVTDQFRVLGGIRRTFDDKISRGTNAAFIPALISATGPNVNRLFPKQVFNATTYKAGAQYDFTPEIMGYVSYQTGFKDGGYNVSVSGNAYLPEEIKSWEIGVKSTLFDGSTTLNVSAFHYDYSNMQINRIIPIPGVSASIMDNAPATIKGIEIEGESYLTDNLKANIGIGLMDPEFGTFAATNNSGAVPVIVNLTGYQLPRAPKMTVNLGLEHTMQLADLGELKTRGEYNYQSRIWYSAFNEQMARQDGYSVWNLIFTFTPANCENLQFQAWVRNLTGKDYVTSATPSGTWRSSKGEWGAPRTFGGSVTAKF